MTEDMLDLARRAVACPKWRWMPGMLDLFGRRVLCVWPDDLGIKWSHLPENCVVRDADALPDITDPATLGCLLALVREAWGMPTGIIVSYSSDEGLWGVSWCGATHGGWCGRGDTEAEALVAALECAP
jgi:hypothetical protein